MLNITKIMNSACYSSLKKLPKELKLIFLVCFDFVFSVSELYVETLTKYKYDSVRSALWEVYVLVSSF